MQQAKYSILIPRVDNQGNRLRDIAAAAHHFLFYGPLKTQGSYIERGKIGNWRDLDPEPHDMLITVAEDSPEMDSSIKQLALEVAQVANQWGIFVMKEGNGITSWEVGNPQYVEGAPADQAALEEPESAANPPLLAPSAGRAAHESRYRRWNTIPTPTSLALRYR